MVVLFIVLDIFYCIGFCVITKTLDDEVVTNKEYNSACVRCRIAAWTPFVIYTIALIISGLKLLESYPSYDAPIGMTVKIFFCWWMDMLFTGIRSLNASSYLTTKLKINPLEEPNEQTKKNFSKEKNNKKYGSAAIIGGTFMVGKHIKKAIKDITD